MIKPSQIFHDLRIILLYLMLILISSIWSAYEQLNYLSVIYFVFLMIFDRIGLFMLFFVLILSNGVIPKEQYIFGVLGVQQTISVLALIASAINLRKARKYSTKIDKVFCLLILFYFTYILYTTFKNAYFGIFETTYLRAVLQSINLLIVVVVLLTVYKQYNSEKIFYLRIALNTIIFFASLTIFQFAFSNNLHAQYEQIEGIQRYTGFIGNGDSNTLALIMVIGIAIVLSYHNKIKNSFENFYTMTVLALAILTIGFSASRSGLLLALLVFILFFWRNRVNSRTVVLYILLSFTVIASLPLLSRNIQRLHGATEEQISTKRGTSNRVGKWMFYVNFIADNPKTLIRGANKEIKVQWNHSFKVAHNLYLQIIYNSGLIILVILLIAIKKIALFANKYNKDIWIVFLPLILGLGFISDLGALLFFIISFPSFFVKKTMALPRKNAYIPYVELKNEGSAKSFDLI